jgi:hypothetical protein
MFLKTRLIFIESQGRAQWLNCLNRHCFLKKRKQRKDPTYNSLNVSFLNKKRFTLANYYQVPILETVKASHLKQRNNVKIKKRNSYKT